MIPLFRKITRCFNIRSFSQKTFLISLEPSAGFGPATITLPMGSNIDPNIVEFEKWVRAKYSVSYRRAVLCYVKKYHHLLKADSNLRDLELLTNDVKSSVVKSLLLYSKFNGAIHSSKTD